MTPSKPAAAAKSLQSCLILQSHRWQPTRLPCPWDSPGKNTGMGCHFLLQCMNVKSEREVAQSCPTLSDPMDCSVPGSSVHGILQARTLEWGAIAFSASEPNTSQRPHLQIPTHRVLGLQHTDSERDKSNSIYSSYGKEEKLS